LICRYHHYVVHHRRHRLALRADATLEVTRPDVTVLTSRPRGPTVATARAPAPV
jgi:hypothetical protein